VRGALQIAAAAQAAPSGSSLQSLLAVLLQSGPLAGGDAVYMDALARLADDLGPAGIARVVDIWRSSTSQGLDPISAVAPVLLEAGATGEVLARLQVALGNVAANAGAGAGSVPVPPVPLAQTLNAVEPALPAGTSSEAFGGPLLPTFGDGRAAAAKGAPTISLAGEMPALAAGESSWSSVSSPPALPPLSPYALANADHDWDPAFARGVFGWDEASAGIETPLGALGLDFASFG
jgi:hypothetical protein